MKTARAMIVVVAALVALGGAAPALAQEAGEGEGPKMVERKIKIPTKRYHVVGARDVYDAAANGAQADVRFKDVMNERVEVRGALREVRLGRDERYRIAVALRTTSNLTLLVPASRARIVETVFGLPRDWPLTEEVLQQEIVLKKGQEIFVEGTILGEVGLQKSVLVDGLHTQEAALPAALREVQVFWPRADEPGSIGRPGSESFEFSCNHVANRNALVSVTVREMPREKLVQELALRHAGLQVAPGQPAEATNYANFDVAAVYQQANRGEQGNVDFTDSVQRVLAEVPEHLRTVPGMRYGRQVELAIGAVFRTTNRITCVIPSTLATPMAQVASILGGENLRIRGRVMGEILGEKVVRVDYIGFPDVEKAEPFGSAWLVTIEWPSRPVRTLEIWDFGTYTVMDLPCLHQPGRREAIRVVMRQYREITVMVPAPQDGEDDGDDGGIRVLPVD